MSELEIQAAFRDQVLRDLAGERATLEDLSERVAKLEQTVMHGNGHPALTVQVKELETKVDNLSRDVSLLRDEMREISGISASIIEIKTRMDLMDKGRANWIGFITVIATIIVTALVNRFL